MEKREYMVYDYSELSDTAKERARGKVLEWFSNDSWWDFVEEDAERVGVKIDTFDLDSRSISLRFINGAEECAWKIEKEHGDETETFKAAKEFLRLRDEAVETAEKDETGGFTYERDLDDKLDKLEEEFLDSLGRCYLYKLWKEYEWHFGTEHVEETIEANEYKFLKDGTID